MWKQKHNVQKHIFELKKIQKIQQANATTIRIRCKWIPPKKQKTEIRVTSEPGTGLWRTWFYSLTAHCFCAILAIASPFRIHKAQFTGAIFACEGKLHQVFLTSWKPFVPWVTRAFATNRDFYRNELFPDQGIPVNERTTSRELCKLNLLSFKTLEQ